MNLYLISQDRNNGYDTYDSAVVAADTEEEAIRTHPQLLLFTTRWNEEKSRWENLNNNGDYYEVGFDSWTWPKYVKVELIGMAVEGTKAGVIIASFHAG